MKTGSRQWIYMARRLAGAGLASLGFILSPFSWWNDAIVNIPLALIAARLASEIVDVSFGLLFTIFYWTSNIIGILMMVAGASYSLGRKPSRRDIAVGLIASTVYTVVVLLLVG